VALVRAKLFQEVSARCTLHWQHWQRSTGGHRCRSVSAFTTHIK